MGGKQIPVRLGKRVGIVPKLVGFALQIVDRGSGRMTKDGVDQKLHPKVGNDGVAAGEFAVMDC